MMTKTIQPLACFAALMLAAGGFLAAQPASDLLEKAPPHIDKALRERVRFFYQAHVDGKFRLADQVVHEDSKDAFFAADKRRYKDFDIIKINYEQNFTKARVVVAVKTDFFMPGAGRMPVTIPLTTLWKYDDGTWWWYVEPHSPEEGTETPFGIMKPGSEAESSSPFQKLQNMPGANAIRSQVKVSGTSVTLKCGEGGDTGEIVVSNGMPGVLKLQLSMPEAEGFSAHVENEVVPARGETKVLFSCEANPELAGKTIRGALSIQPTNHRIPLTVRFQAPDQARSAAR